ncbi:dual specificity protein phosphatase 14-like isoform X2 [Physella acuta]|nr:dual specificity protein phosphatase 14-like isoform X2 [Physella acuta]XP_059144113.1 dual specificity protein phosphatase 14-like isoform X2 [Physella acuta]XP_059144122.1 dual specificity protein phosphatase 14-like isoform X2 [Physella acuta]XP_059144129.1 dual specificity protein phosphatase 14-like isoform X2 [Physella acuta]XP_059144137.1 dual specificity protein phosphatase 14-like isoform X2 [Physella acuta]XP_059144144.1 dual specificity protein phosphatase 14-like isoform X2 [Phy
MDLAMFSQVAEVTSSLYLSSAAAVRGEKIRSLGITHIINVTLEIPNLQLPNLESIQIHIEDTPTARLGLYFDRCADKIHQVEKKGGKTLVHCVAGVSRSASLCIAYLMKYHSMSLEQAYRHVKRRRSVIHPNVGFWRQLIDFERRLFGRTSVKMVQSSIGWVPDVYCQEPKSLSWMPSTTSRYGY